MIRFHTALESLMVPAESVTPDPRNPNNGETDEIIASIQLSGCYRPVYAARETGHIVAGHHLYAALLELGADHIPVLWLDGDDEQALRILLGDNQIARLARMDDALLLGLLRDLQDTGLGLLGTGYTDESIDRLLRDHPAEYTPPPDPEPLTCPHCGQPIDRSLL
ncbi:MAG TPA: ParB N-terminal domain-containing protein [Actinomycetes bacterium]|nr:ParB N-terminal domain-containing protein [Actinomycetes bacterium]